MIHTHTHTEFRHLLLGYASSSSLHDVIFSMKKKLKTTTDKLINSIPERNQKSKKKKKT